MKKVAYAQLDALPSGGFDLADAGLDAQSAAGDDGQ